MQLLVSIHDVMPATLDQTERILARLCDAGLQPVTLLVVPGRDWRACDLERLRTWSSTGAELAGHGWSHEVRSIRGWKHRTHAALLSRRAAEHLALSAAEIDALMRANHAWFEAHHLPAPTLYVPPAWALGPIGADALRTLPFRRIETLAGVRDLQSGTFRALPLAGFEVDSLLREIVVRPSNALNRMLARTTGRPLRLGIHPGDPTLRLADALEDWIARGGESLSYAEITA